MSYGKFLHFFFIFAYLLLSGIKKYSYITLAFFIHFAKFHKSFSTKIHRAGMPPFIQIYNNNYTPYKTY